MLTITVAAVLVAAVVAFITGGLWYSPVLFGNSYLTLRGLDAQTGAAIPTGEIIAEFARCLIISGVVAHFVRLLGITTLSSALTFGLWMWVAISTVVAGSVLHEGYAWRLYAIHVGDGLVKVLLITAIVVLWRPR